MLVKGLTANVSTILFFPFTLSPLYPLNSTTKSIFALLFIILAVKFEFFSDIFIKTRALLQKRLFSYIFIQASSSKEDQYISPKMVTRPSSPLQVLYTPDTNQQLVKVLHVVRLHHGKVPLGLHVHNLGLCVRGLHPEPCRSPSHGGGGRDQLPGRGTDGDVPCRRLENLEMQWTKVKLICINSCNVSWSTFTSIVCQHL